MKDALTLKYAGAAVDAGRMDAYEAAGNIIAFADFIGVAARAAYGENAKLKTEIRAFEHGSFAVQFALDFGGILATLLTSAGTPKDIYDLVSQSFSAWKHLRGTDPVEVTAAPDNRISIKNSSGQIAVYRAETINIITSPEASAAAARFVRKPLEGEVETVSITQQDGTEIASANKAEAPYIGFLAARETLTENTMRMWLTLESPTFKGGNKWKFADDRTSFRAPIEDQEFLNRVARHETLFGQDDAMLVDIKIRQSGQPLCTIKADRTILKVVEHRHAPQQSALL
ncbi:MAG: hypothetical protein Q8O37_04610 [Sulfuricellaceae bacterium]|nr:hypothetical protein [Sulfuricellaceae bacterium]